MFEKTSPFDTPTAALGAGAAVVLILLLVTSSAALPTDAVLLGRVVEKESGEPVAFTNILLVEINRSVTSSSDGRFRLDNLPYGKVTLKTFRIGYTNLTMPIELTADTMRLVLKLERAVIHLGGVTIEATRGNGDAIAQPDLLFSDKKLHQALGQTIAKTIDYEPGISQRTMGPAPARPILRGLGGDRLMILEDQQHPGDLSATSSDHAVVIEPMTAERIEVIRGPEALIFGSKVLGGVVNVARGSVPSRRPARTTGSAALSSESAVRGYAGGLELSAPLGPLALRIDGSRRNSGNMRTPLGTLINTDMAALNGSGGVSLVRSWGYAGAAFGVYSSRYGIPPDPKGGHPSGVRIDLERRNHELRGEYLKPMLFLGSQELFYSRTIYHHQEFEKNGMLGVEFGLVSHQFTWRARMKEYRRLEKGLIGLQLGCRDTASGGLTFTPNTLEQSAGVFYYQEAHWSNFILHGSLRFDHTKVKPRRERTSLYVGRIRARTFSDLSAAISPHWLINKTTTVGCHLMRTFRAPMAQELFSEGPHLAAYSYEIGNADLGKENALGFELFADVKHEDTFFHLAVFQNDIRGYVFPNNTGQRSWQRADLFVYQFVGLHALMRGAEASFHLPLLRRFHAAGTVSYVHGSLAETGRPLPYIPPLEGKFNLGWSTGHFDLSASVRAASAQRRVGEFEAPTDGYAVFDLSSHYTFMLGPSLCTASLAVENLFDMVYRKHLNRVREIMPEQGRNLRLLVKMFM